MANEDKKGDLVADRTQAGHLNDGDLAFRLPS